MHGKGDEGFETWNEQWTIGCIVICELYDDDVGHRQALRSGLHKYSHRCTFPKALHYDL